ncbi:ACT domain-containing protein [Oscillospiraceae bacterium MB08-C2-2]|nr:ACT domain-containing protein [Oscillospiraceae bacterium MB08-C2-2]
MPDTTLYYLVEAKVLPEVFTRVMTAKRFLAQGKAKSLSEAAEMAGISRSALYKYKDSVFTYDGEQANQIATIYAELEDEPGILSSLLSQMYEHGANILTINQNIPVDGVAPVSISMRTDNLRLQRGELVLCLKRLPGVVNVKLIAN